jgi:hypothetical protein
MNYVAQISIVELFNRFVQGLQECSEANEQTGSIMIETKPVVEYLNSKGIEVIDLVEGE